MLYPQTNAFRQVKDISGFWDFRLDPSDLGLKKAWFKGVPKDRTIAVPASWNDQFEDTRNYFDNAWYQTRFDQPWGWDGQKIFLRFNSVNYLTRVWLNGKKLGGHEGGHLPFVFDITKHIKPEGNLLVVRVNGQLAMDRVPPGNIVSFDKKDAFGNGNVPPVSYDFFPYCGIHRSVILFTMPPEAIQDLTVLTSFKGKVGQVRVRVQTDGRKITGVRAVLKGFGKTVQVDQSVKNKIFEIILTVPDVKLWAPGFPHLYDLTVQLLRERGVLDQVSLPIGIRTIQVRGDRLYLNGKVIFLKGFGRHEDFSITGRSLPPAVMVKDYELMKWIGANSFRTTHYPYSDEMMRLADQLGFLVIDEIPAVGLFFRKKGLKKRLQLCRQYTQELIARDKNHPSVVLWSLANEPHSHRSAAKPFFKNLAQLARGLDQTRPITLVSYIGLNEESFQYFDVVCVNRYIGWYVYPGDLKTARVKLSEDLDAIYRRYRKPVILSEFGADALPGSHSKPPVLFSEEYQVEMIKCYLEVLNQKDYVIGAHVWNLCDFKTAQATGRPSSMNWKGVFTRDRQPKMAAYFLHQMWTGNSR